MISVILLAGGSGSRLKNPIPKQYLPLNNKPVALHSFDTFKSCSLVSEIIVVCKEQYQHFFSNHSLFAPPGNKRQDSVYSGLLKASCDICLIHDAARPFFDPNLIEPLLNAVKRSQAAGYASKVTATIKKCDNNLKVIQTLDRNEIWEMQTPQACYTKLLLKAFEKVFEQNIECTDDLSVLETIGIKPEIIPSSNKNFKITNSLDFAFANFLCATN